MDSTYFGRLWGVMVFRNFHEKENILSHEILWETVQQYKDGIRKLKEMGHEIVAIVCDGKRGILGGFGDIPTQMCHTHQRAIIRRYITRTPKLKANIELKEIVSMLGKIRKDTFIKRLENWYNRYESFLKEKSENGKFVHERTRKAYKSLKTNLPYLFIYEDYPDLKIPKDTNSLESVFSHMKDKVRLHRGLSKENKLKVCLELLSS